MKANFSKQTYFNRLLKVLAPAGTHNPLKPLPNFKQMFLQRDESEFQIYLNAKTPDGTVAEVVLPDKTIHLKAGRHHFESLHKRAFWRHNYFQFFIAKQ